MAEKKKSISTEKATFGAGCFWHVEDDFMEVKGVTKTTVGYTGGKMKNPTYQDVCSDETGHIEVVELEFDPKIVSYEELLERFWKIHDPTTMDRQGPDFGTQYKSIIFYHSPQQKKSAEASKKKLQNSGKYSRPVVTEIRAAETFYPAEEYHQKYYQKHNTKTCRVF